MIRVQSEPLDVAAELAGFARGRTDVGGIASFVGVVRAEHGGEPVLAMTLEHYPGMTERQLAAIEAEARGRWPLRDSLVVHRVGRMLPGEAIVLVATASAHRGAALELLRLPDRLAQDPGAVLEARGNPGGRALGRRPGSRRCRGRAVGSAGGLTGSEGRGLGAAAA